MKYMDVELKPTLRQFSKAQLGRHHSDWQTDMRVLHNMKKGVWVWILCKDGTWLFPMSSCLVDGHFANRIIGDYAKSTEPCVYGFVIEQTDATYGCVYDINLKKLHKLISENCVKPDSKKCREELRIACRLLQHVYQNTKMGQVDSRVRKISKEAKGYGI